LIQIKPFKQRARLLHEYERACVPADDRCKSRGQYQAALVTLASNEVLVFDLTAIFSSLLILESQEA